MAAAANQEKRRECVLMPRGRREEGEKEKKKTDGKARVRKSPLRRRLHVPHQ